MIDPHIPLKELQKFNEGTLVDALGIEFTGIGEHHLEARMRVDERTVQPLRLLHGGASAALAETLGSMASALMIDRERYTVRGIHITADHVGGAKEGFVYGRADLAHEGRTTHVWDIKVIREDGKTVSLCRLTTMVLSLNEKNG